VEYPIRAIPAASKVLENHRSTGKAPEQRGPGQALWLTEVANGAAELHCQLLGSIGGAGRKGKHRMDFH
jgi:hypothetical protein